MREHCPELWPDDRRERKWTAHFLGAAGMEDTHVLVRHYAVLDEGEHLTEYPRTVELDWDEWLSGHHNYGLDVDGKELST
jgi:hypothetical protein